MLAPGLGSARRAPCVSSCEREGWTRSSRGATAQSPHSLTRHTPRRAGGAVFCVVVQLRVEDEHMYFVRACYGISPAELFNECRRCTQIGCSIREACCVLSEGTKLCWTGSVVVLLSFRDRFRWKSKFQFVAGVVSISWSETRIKSAFYPETKRASLSSKTLENTNLFVRGIQIQE
jgi:hypothetical protein